MFQLLGFKPDGVSGAGNAWGAIGTVVLADSTFKNVSIGVITSYNTSFIPAAAGSLQILNTDFSGANASVAYQNGTVILEGRQFVSGWMQGPEYPVSYHTEVFPSHPNETCWAPTANPMLGQGSFNPPPTPAGLLDLSTSKIFDRSKPVYDDWSLNQFVSAKNYGCKGDGITDDTICLQNFFNSVNWNQIAYIDHGAYVVTSTILIPKNIRILGEAWPKIMITSSSIWSDMTNPIPAFIVGNKGDVGDFEMQDVVFETRGPTPGAILMEFNLESATQGSAGILSTSLCRRFLTNILQACGMSTGE
jgi:glucan 1,3-beta-glucosidase